MASAAGRQEPGFAVNGVAMIQTDARYAGYSQEQAQALYENFRNEVATTPGVQSAVLTRGMPMEVTGIPVVIEGNGQTPDTVAIPGSIWAGPGYFDTLQIPLLFGRDFDAGDGRDTPQVVVINESMAREYFGTVNAVGRRFRFQPDTSPWLEVIGVLQDTRTSDVFGDLVDPTPYLFYRSFAQSGLPPNVLLARTSLDAADLVGMMQRQLRVVDPTLPVISAKTMTQHLEESLGAPRTVATFLGILGLLGIALAGVGLYAVIAYAVSRRSREIGIRMALGAKSRQVVWTVAREVAMLVGVGTIVGLILSIVASLALRQVNISTTSTSFSGLTVDPLALLYIAGFVAFVGFLAAFIPARRAARMNPLSALRHD
jgi:predicted permease